MDLVAPRTRRRWLQFSLRSLLVLTAISGVLISWIGPRFYYAHQQRQAVEAVLASGGQVYYDFQAAGGMEPPGPKWLRRIVGDDFFQHVEGVAYQGQSSQNADLAPLRRLPHLKALSIHLFPSSTIDFGPLADLDSLKILALRGKGCTDAHLSAIARLKRLETLSLEATSVTDAGLDDLGELAELRDLHIGGDVSDVAMLKLKPLAKLTTLWCSRFMVKGGYGRIVESLDTRTECEFSAVPVVDVAQYFSVRHDIPILVDTADPKVAKLVDSVAVTDRQESVTLQVALETMLWPLGLDWTGSPNGLLITTREKAAENRRGLEELKKALPNLTTVKTDW